MTIRLAFCGASGTGKTTLATRLASLFDIPLCPVGSRSVSEGMGFKSPYDVDAAGRRGEFQQLLVHAKAEWELAHQGTGFVTDRTHLDNLAYTITHAPDLGRDSGFRGEIDAAMRGYTHIVFCPVAAFHDLAGDPSRIEHSAYHLKYEDVMVDLFGSFVHVAPILWLTSGHAETRVAQVRRFAGMP